MEIQIQTSINPQILSDYHALSDEYHKNFERVFVMNPTTGNLMCIDEEIDAWYNSQIEFICIFIGFMPQRLDLIPKPNIQTLQVDRLIQLNIAYVYAYIAYRKQNNLYAKVNDPMYTPSLFVE